MKTKISGPQAMFVYALQEIAAAIVACIKAWCCYAKPPMAQRLAPSDADADSSNAKTWAHVTCVFTDQNMEVVNLLKEAPFVPAGLLGGPNTQTMLAELLRSKQNMVGTSKTTCIQIGTDDGSEVVVHVVNACVAKPKAVAIVTHGISGCESDLVMWKSHCLVHGIVGALYVRRWHCPRRGVADADANTCPPSFVNNKDCGLVVEHMRAMYPDTPIVGVGYSAGGPHLVHYAQYAAENGLCSFAALAVMSCANDFVAYAKWLDGCPEGMAINSLLRQLMARVVDQGRLRRLGRNDVADAVEAARTLTQLDGALAGLRGFGSGEECYEASCPMRAFKSLRVPTLYMAAEDDPFLPKNQLKNMEAIAGSNKNVVTVLTRSGGHCGWIDKRLNCWADGLVLRFLLSKVAGETTKP